MKLLEIKVIFYLNFCLLFAAVVYGLAKGAKEETKKNQEARVDDTIRVQNNSELARRRNWLNRKKYSKTKSTTTTKATTKIPKIENPRKLYLFCKNCTADRQQWTQLEEIFGSYLNETPKETRPSIILSKNYTFAELAYGINEFPAFVFVDHNSTSTFDASSMNFTSLSDWLTSGHLEEKKLYTIITQTNFKEKIQNSNKLWLLLLKNDNDDHESCKRYGEEYLEFLKHKLNEKELNAVEVGVMETVDLNYVFVRKRLNIDPFKEDCPIYVKILHYHFDTFIGWEFVSNEKMLTEKVINFVETPFDEKKAKQITIELTDVEYSYHDLQFKIDRTLTNKTFIAIGITGGLSVIALAVSIFWGLKSSSFGTDQIRKP